MIGLLEETMNKLLFSLLICLLVIPFVFGLSVDIPGATTSSITIYTNATSYNVTYANYVSNNISNNSYCWQGHCSTDGSWLTGITTSGNIFDQSLNTTDNVTFFNVNATNGFFSILYDYVGLLAIDLDNRLLYDLAEILSLDFNDRKLYASDGTDVILDWNNVGVADFEDSNITTTGNIISPSYCNSTSCYNVTAFLKDDVGGTDSWSLNYTNYYNATIVNQIVTGNISTDTWALNYSDYYNKTQIDNNLSNYAKYEFLDNNFNGSGNFTTSGFGSFGGLNITDYWARFSGEMENDRGTLGYSNIEIGEDTYPTIIFDDGIDTWMIDFLTGSGLRFYQSGDVHIDSKYRRDSY